MSPRLPIVKQSPRRGIQSIEIGAQLLLALANHVAPMALRDVAKAAAMSAGKAHPYLVSFVKVGLVAQTEAGQYELGPLALQLGLAKLQRLDPIKQAAPLVEQLAAASGQSIALAVWGNLGPTIVRLDEPTQPLHVNLRTGTVMSLAHTATGRLFAAYLPAKVVERLMQEDMQRLGGGAARASAKELEAQLSETRRYGLSRTIGQPIPGINAFSAPVFDANDHLALAITAMGPAATFNAAWNGAVAKALKDCAAEVSRRLGHIKN